MSALQFKRGIGNKQHYLMQCNNAKFTNIREVFIYKLNQINHSFSYFNNHDLFIYILAMKDKFINNLVAKYCFNVLTNVEQL